MKKQQDEQASLTGYEEPQTTLSDDSVTGVTQSEEVPIQYIHGVMDEIDGVMKPVDPCDCEDCQVMWFSGLPCFLHYRLVF
jgi:hypothetical protein